MGESSALEELLAKQSITEVIYGYCRGLDRMDRSLAVATWHDGGTADYGPIFEGTGAAFVDWAWKAHEAFVAHSHQVTNILIDVDLANDTAVSESYVTVALRTPEHDGASADVVGRGRYVDRWSRRAGRWAVDHRQYLDDFGALYPVASNEISDRSGSTGRRGPDDPSYDVLS
jgi:SnoaL-like protein